MKAEIPVGKNTRYNSTKREIFRSFFRLFSGAFLIAFCLACLQFSGCSTTGTKEEVLASDQNAPTIEETWGVQIEGIRYSAAGYMLDFRYRFINPDKAEYLLDRRYKPYLIDQKTGARFTVPAPAKVGPLRQSLDSGKPMAGKTYFVMFANPGRYVKPGNKVTVVIGDFRADNLTVE